MSGATAITVRVPLAIRRKPGCRTVVTPVGEPAGVVRTRTDPALLKALARAFRWQKLLDEGRYGSMSELAAAEKIERGYLGKVLQLTLLPPDLVQAIVDGRQGMEVTLPVLLSGSSQHHFHCNQPPLTFSVEGQRKTPKLESLP